jgi:very-short-patch-repair endonuclease
MHSIHRDVHRRGGVAAAHELLRDGHTSHRLTAAVRRGEVIRARQGHYVCPHLSQPEIEAVRVGGRLAGANGARHHGIWAPRTQALTVLVRPDARALRTRTDPRARLAAAVADPLVRVAWSDRGAPGTRSVASPAVCLRGIALRESAAAAFASAESALFTGNISRAQLRRMVASLPRSRRGLLQLAGSRSESGGESLLAYRLLRARLGFEQQRVIAGVGRVDVVIGDRLVIEVDGAGFHTDIASFEQDRRRDALLSALGFRVLRFSYRQVEQRPGEVMSAIRGAIARGDHL